MDTLIEFATSGLLGGVFGGLLRFAPEVLKYLNGKADRAHELAMQALQIDRDKLLHDQAISKIGAEAQIVLDRGGLDALKAAIMAQGAPTGIGWVDALSATVRPIVTYWYMALYSVVKLAMLAVGIIAACIAAGGEAGWVVAVGIANAIAAAWTPADMALFSGIMNFWFLDRVIRKNTGV